MKSVGPQFSISPEPGEQLLLMKEFRGTHNHIFAMTSMVPVPWGRVLNR